MKLQDKIAIVTGSSRGIGKAVAMAMAKEGAHIVVAALGSDEGKPGLPGTIEETVAEIKALGRKALPVACNVADEEAVINMVEQTLKEFGTIDILFNNAGVMVHSPTVDMPMKRFDLVMGVNTRGSYLCSKYVLPTMIKNKKGSIINMSSSGGVDHRIGKTDIVYGMAKAANERFTYGLAAEVAEYNIAVNCIKPRGAISTEGTRLWANQAGRSGGSPPSGQPQGDTTEMIEKAVIFLAQQDAQHGISGTVANDEEVCTWHNLL